MSSARGATGKPFVCSDTFPCSIMTVSLVQRSWYVAIEGKCAAQSAAHFRIIGALQLLDEARLATRVIIPRRGRDALGLFRHSSKLDHDNLLVSI